jgi:isochorismate hydrolase
MNEHERILEVIRLKDQAPLTFDPHRSALLVIDVQRYFVSPDYPFAQVLERRFQALPKVISNGCAT